MEECGCFNLPKLTQSSIISMYCLGTQEYKFYRIKRALVLFHGSLPSALIGGVDINVSEHVYDTMGNKILDFYFYNWTK